ncbi:MAG: 50S ribosomal protein L19 [Candidatus Omnitrophota bacterium]
MNGIDILEKEMIKKKVPDFRVGNTLKIHIRVKEGDKTRTQIFEGICIRKRGSGARSSFTVLKESHGDVVEKIFPLYSPTVEKIVVTKKDTARRAKLYFMRRPRPIV